MLEWTKHMYPNITLVQFFQIIEDTAKRQPSSGPDGVISKAFTEIASVIPGRLIDILNECLTKGWFPKTWKAAKLTLLRKEGKPENFPSAYRPICLINEVAKTFERIIVSRMNQYMDANERGLSPHQYGFRKKRSTTDAIIKAKQIIFDVNDRGNYAMGISIDIKNAFNTVK